MYGNINAYNKPYEDALLHFNNNQFDWAIVDPPYFDGPGKLGFYGASTSRTGVKREQYHKSESWEVPGYDYYNELVRVSKNQIIWGINYFEFAGEVNGRIIWDKCNDNTNYSKCEIASISSINSVQLFRFMWNGMMQGKSIKQGHIMQGNKKLNEKRIHPTQKPVALYKWMLNKFTNEGDEILDTHLGSGSHAIACYDLNRNLTAFEKDATHFSDYTQRFNAHKQKVNSHYSINFKY